MKKFPFILVCALVFVSCSEKNNISNSVSSESSEITTETVVPIIQPERVVSKSGFNITSNGIEIIQRGEVSQVLEDTNLWDSFKYCGYVPDAGDILIRKDYDGDGYTDLCIPYLHKYSETKSETKNVYYHFDPDTALYEKWEALNKLNGIIEKYDRRNVDYIFNEPPYICEKHDVQNIIYKCDGMELNYAGKELTYTGDDGEKYTDTFFHNHDTDEEQLVKRLKITDGKEEEIFVHPSQCYFTVRENCIDIWWKNGTIQTIEGCYLLGNESHSNCTPHEQNAVFKDTDGDGYDDIYVKEGENAGEYFRFNPETFKFDEV